MLEGLRQRIRAIFMRRRLEREMFEEISAHLAKATERFRAGGLADAEARRAAVREFGPLDVIQEEARDARGGRWAEVLAGDVRYSMRQVTRRPLASVTIVVILALGLGVNSALFAVIHSLETRPPAGIPRDDRLVRIRGTIEDRSTRQRFGRPLAWAEVQRFTERQDLAREIAAWSTDVVELDLPAAAGEPLRARAVFVTNNYFDLLGVRPVAGRVVRGDSELGAVIGYGFWQERFGGSADVIGTMMHVNGSSATIVGVAPPRFRGATVEGDDPVLWLPLASRAVLNGRNPAAFLSGDSAIFSAVARLGPGVALEDARVVIESIADRTRAAASSPGGADESADVVPLLFANDLPSNGAERGTYAVLAGLSLLILAVIGTNVSSLMLGAGVTRRREIVVRLSLGAGRGRVVRQLLTESVMLTCAGGVLGLLGLGLLMTVLRARLPGLDLVMHWPTLVFTAGFAIGAGILCGLSPALHATRLNMSSVLKDTEGGIPTARLGAQRRLVIIQVALTQPLLIALVALMVLLEVDDPHDRVAERSARVVVTTFDRRGATTSRADAQAELADLAARVETVRGVIAVVPHEGGYLRSNLDVHPADRTGTSSGRFTGRGHFAGPGYFELMGIPLVRGRAFSPEDRDLAVAIIGSDLARELWGDFDPIGRRLRRWRSGDSIDVAVVGVVDAEFAGPSEQGDGMRVYVPLHGAGAGGIRVIPQHRSSHELLVLTRGADAEMIRALRNTIRHTGDRVTLRNMSTLAVLAEEARTRAARLSLQAAAVGLLALLIACIGLYAVVALAVRERLREIGIRIALGAGSGQVVRRFMWTGLKLSLAGVALGLPISILVLNRLGIDLNTSAIAVGTAVGLGVIAVTLFATWLPARRAASIDPLATLQVV